MGYGLCARVFQVVESEEDGDKDSGNRVQLGSSSGLDPEREPEEVLSPCLLLEAASYGKANEIVFGARQAYNFILASDT